MQEVIDDGLSHTKARRLSGDPDAVQCSEAGEFILEVPLCNGLSKATCNARPVSCHSVTGTECPYCSDARDSGGGKGKGEEMS